MEERRRAMEESRDEAFMNEADMRTVMASGLFEGLEAEEAEDLLLRLRPQKEAFDKDEFILSCGDYPAVIGLLLSGAANVLKEDFWGRQTVLSSLEPGDIFAEEYALLPDVPMEVSILAAAPSEALFLDVDQILNSRGMGVSGGRQHPPELKYCEGRGRAGRRRPEDHPPPGASGVVLPKERGKQGSCRRLI